MGIALNPATQALDAEQSSGDRAALLRWYYHLVRRWIWLIVLVTIAAGVTGYSVTTLFIKPTYVATATLQVDAGQLSSDVNGTGVIASQQLADTEARLVVTQPVAVKAYKALHLHLPLTPSTLLGGATASSDVNSQLVTLSVSSHDRVFAARAANALAYAAQQSEQQHQMSRFSAAIDAIDRQISSYQKDMASATKKQAQAGGAGNAQTQDLTREIDQDRTAINNLQTQLVTLQSTEAQTSANLDVRVPAQVPHFPSSPHPVRSAAIAAFLALLAATGLLFAREYFAGTLRNPEEFQALMSGAPVLGVVGDLNRETKRPGLSVTENRRSLGAEMYRMVRTNLLFSGADAANKVILMTSCGEGEGKTTTSMNVAMVMAEIGRKVLLIDADLRRPHIHQVAGIENRGGLTALLLGMDGGDIMTSTVQSEADPHLYFLPSGPIPPNPTALLSSQRMRDLLHAFKQSFDTIIVDSPPLLAVTDSAVLSTMADRVVLVADPRKATRHTLLRAKDVLERVGSRVSGVVLNRVGEESSGYYGYYYYGGYSAYVTDGQKVSSGSRNGKRAAK